MSVNRLCTILRYVLCAFFVTCLTIFSIPSTSFAQLGITGYVNFDEDQIVAGLTTNATVSIHKAGGTLGSTNVVVHVILPTGFSLANATGGCSEPTAGAVICNVGSLLAGQSFNSVLALKTAPNILIEMAGGDISVGPQVAEMIGSVSQDGEPNVALSSDEIMVDEYADLHIQNFSSDLEVSVGDNFTYTIFVRNFGPSTARDIIVEDYIATEGANQNQHVQVNANGCSLAVRTEGGLIDEFDCNFASSTGVFQLSTMGANWLNPMTPEIPGSDPPEIDKGLMIITINAQVTSISDGEQGLLENSATVASFTPDPNTGNNISEVQLLVDGEADLSISKSFLGELQDDGTQALPYDLLDPQPFPAPGFSTSALAVTAGRRIRYTLEVSNDGPSRAHNVVVVDGLPAGVAIIPGTLNVVGPNGGGCLFGTAGDPNDKMVCGLGTLGDPNDYDDLESTATISFDVLVDYHFLPQTLLVNSVQVSSVTDDPDNSGDYDSVITVVSPLTGTSGCSVGGPYDAVQCGAGSAELELGGFGFALPEGGVFTYNWTTDCPDGVLSDSTVTNPTLQLSTINPDQSPVACQVNLEVSNSFASSNCSGAITVVDCAFDCKGVAEGPAVLDRCGVCEGDGRSCLGCVAFDASANVLELNTSNETFRGLIRKAGRKILKAGGDRGFVRRSKVKAKRWSKYAEAITSFIQTSGEVCSNESFCTTSVNVQSTDDALQATFDMERLLKRMVKVLRREKGQPRIGRRLLLQGAEQMAGAQSSAAAIPVSTSSCS